MWPLWLRGNKAAMTNHDFKQVLNMWLRNIKDVYRLHREELEAISNPEKREDRLTELNVKEQVSAPGKNFNYSACMEASNGP